MDIQGTSETHHPHQCDVEAHKELLVTWLNDAYATEKALIPVLENHAKDARDYPEIQSRIQRHIDETRRHADIVQGCIEHLGEDVSRVKGGWGTLLGSLKSISTGMFQDELIKNALSDYAAECFEIACYKSLIAAARHYGDNEVAQACEEILHEEEAMAQWLEDYLPQITEDVMHQKTRAKS